MASNSVTRDEPATFEWPPASYIALAQQAVEKHTSFADFLEELLVAETRMAPGAAYQCLLSLKSDSGAPEMAALIVAIRLKT
jgi:hypothetical protein